MNSVSIFTLIVCLVILFYALGGYRKGFIKTLMSMAFFIMAAVLVYFASPYVSGFLKDHTPVYGMIEEKCQDIFTLENLDQFQEGQDKREGQEEDGALEGLNRIEQSKVIEKLPLPDIIKKQLTENNNPTGYAKLAVSGFESYMSAFMANLVLTILSYIVTFLLAVLVLKILLATLDVITELPGLKGLNRLLGLALGAVQGICVVWIFFLIITIFGSTDIGGKLLKMISESSVLSFLYDSNIFLKILMGMLGGMLS